MNKTYYRLKQSGNTWNDELNNKLLKINFKRLVSDPCIYIKRDTNNNIVCIIGVYVDDILLTGIDSEINKTKILFILILVLLLSFPYLLIYFIIFYFILYTCTSILLHSIFFYFIFKYTF